MPTGNWEANHLQAVLFLKRALPPRDLFTAVVGTEADSVEDRPKEGRRVQSGIIGGSLLQVTVNPQRVDITQAPVLSAEEFLNVASLGPFEAAVDNFAAMVKNWLPHCDFPTIRLAVVARAFAPAASATEAYEILRDNLTSVQVQPGKMRDMIFRVNWPATTTIMPEGYLNRLSTWASIDAVARTLGASGGDVVMSTRHFAHREIDVSTPVEHAEELPRDALMPIFDELFQLVAGFEEVGEAP